MPLHCSHQTALRSIYFPAAYIFLMLDSSLQPPVLNTKADKHLAPVIEKKFDTSNINKDISYDLAVEALKDIVTTSESQEISVNRIKEKVSTAFGIKMDDFNSKKRTRTIAYPRQIAMYLSRELTDLSLPKIGNEFGGRDHTTVIHAHDKISKDLELEKNSELKEKISKIIAELKG